MDLKSTCPSPPSTASDFHLFDAACQLHATRLACAWQWLDKYYQTFVKQVSSIFWPLLVRCFLKLGKWLSSIQQASTMQLTGSIKQMVIAWRRWWCRRYEPTFSLSAFQSVPYNLSSDPQDVMYGWSFWRIDWAAICLPSRLFLHTTYNVVQNKLGKFFLSSNL